MREIDSSYVSKNSELSPSSLESSIVPATQKQEAASNEILCLCVTPGDLYLSQRSGLRNPILCALQRQTLTLWRLYDDGFALEAMPPHRVCQLPPEAIEQWQKWQLTGEFEVTEWEIELVCTQECDCYALIQRRHTNLQEKALLRKPAK